MMDGQRLFIISAGVWATIFVLTGLLDPMPAYYIRCASFVSLAAALLAFNWRSLENRWGWLAGAVITSALLIYMGYPTSD
ncbi:MAG: hypothetical protein NVV62_04220 [Terricaulis sp.]|nr:hypothetical protein [Terricaulis sp.]